MHTCTHAQRVTRENQELRHHHRMAPASRLLRKQSEEEVKEVMADLAAEAAATAASRSTKIREETQKISEQREAEERERELRRVRGEVVQCPEEEIHDIIREKGVHKMKLSEKLPWLQTATMEEEEEEEEEVEEERADEILSPDSGLVDHLSGGSPVEVDEHGRHWPAAIPTHLQNGEGEEMEGGRTARFMLEPLIPPPDYPRQTPAKRDFPQGGMTAQGNLLADNDYYSLMMED